MLQNGACRYNGNNGNWQFRGYFEEGLATCSDGHILTGLYRSAREKGVDKIGNINQGECKSASANLRSANDCYSLALRKSDFTQRGGFVQSDAGYYIYSTLTTEKGFGLNNIVEFQCCRPKGALTVDGECYNQGVRISMDDEGWSRCNEGYYMQGISRDNGNGLNCLEEFRCC